MIAIRPRCLIHPVSNTTVLSSNAVKGLSNSTDNSGERVHVILDTTEAIYSSLGVEELKIPAKYLSITPLIYVSLSHQFPSLSSIPLTQFWRLMLEAFL